MKVFWTIFELLINLTQSLILAYFLCKYLGFKEMIKYKQIYIIILTTVNFALISIFNYFTNFESFLGIICYILISFIFSIKFLNGTILKKVFISISVFVLTGILSILILFLYSRIFNVSIVDIMVQAPDIYRFVANCSVIILLFSITKIILKLKESDYNLEFKQWFALIVIPIFSLVIVGSIVEYLIHIDSQLGEIFLIISIILILALNVTMHIIISWLNRSNIIILENTLLKYEKEMQENHVLQIKNLYKEISGLKHDLKYYADTSKNLLLNGEDDKLKKYLDEVSENKIKGVINTVCATGNLVVDGIINYKMSYAKSRGITVKTDIKYKIQNISDTNMSIILGNLLDNAIEASLLQENEKMIKISIEKKKEYIFINISNKIDTSVKASNPTFTSTKKDRKKHGWGLKSVRNIVEKYKGLFEIYEEDDFFVAEAFIHEPNL